jgi:hypothetical protein
MSALGVFENTKIILLFNHLSHVDPFSLFFQWWAYNAIKEGGGCINAETLHTQFIWSPFLVSVLLCSTISCVQAKKISQRSVGAIRESVKDYTQVDFLRNRASPPYTEEMAKPNLETREFLLFSIYITYHLARLETAGDE